MKLTDDDRFMAKPIILITGATGGVGFGICLRLLYQLSQPMQSDLSLASKGITGDQGLNEQSDELQSVFATPNGLVFLLACRSQSKFHATRTELLKGLHRLFRKENISEHEEIRYSYIDQQTGQVELLSFADYRKQWLARLQISWVPMDLYRGRSAVEAVKLIEREYGYLSHLLLNAGGGPFVGVNWLGLIRAFSRNILQAVTYPDYLIEAPTVAETEDRLPETWQLNVFTHYLLARQSLPLLAKGAQSLSAPTRIIWTGSLDGQRKYFDREDYQCFQPGHSYHSTKYQVELLGQGFKEVIDKHGFKGDVISVVAHPGVVAGNMFLLIIGRMMNFLMCWVFYFARTILGSPHHLISAYSAALVWSHLCLAEAIQVSKRGLRYGVQCDRWGSPIVVIEDMEEPNELKERQLDRRLILDGCDQRANALMRIWEIN
ncbi:hypothetical protein O181_015051 [Austropuccinia psidii MF-1]|uniref:3-keto-steroid reductase n=1 Tax=Austropuccinia psidii MF-1 TaxID=1389203 RepID=A0A9Q3BZA0_9BASI|nr:hypothetical protein [Austropuccinia psidii MF-1]